MGWGYKKLLKNPVWFIHGPLTFTTDPDQTKTGSNGAKGVLHIPQVFRTGASSTDTV